MDNLLENVFTSFYETWGVIYLIIFSRYVLAASLFFGVFYLVFKNKFSSKKIQKKFPKKKDYLREFGNSAFAVIIFGLAGALFVSGPFAEYTVRIHNFNSMPLWYHLLTFPIMLVIHDTYFYWMHRSIHHPKLYKLIHLVHHKSTNPSPWAAYSFHPLEAVLEAAILPIILLTLPVHIVMVGLFFLFSIIYNVYGHLGYELYPKGFNKHWFGKWLNTSIHHNLHHKYNDNSFGLYFTFWDRLMGTMHAKYDESFDDVKGREVSMAH